MSTVCCPFIATAALLAWCESQTMGEERPDPDRMHEESVARQYEESVARHAAGPRETDGLVAGKATNPMHPEVMERGGVWRRTG